MAIAFAILSLASIVVNFHVAEELDFILVVWWCFDEWDQHIDELFSDIFVFLQVPDSFEKYLFLGLFLELEEGKTDWDCSNKTEN